MIKTWVLEVPLKIARLTSSRVIRGGAFDEQVQWLMMVDVEKGDQRKELLLTPFQNNLISRCHGVMSV